MKTLCLALLLLSFGVLCSADRDIVYAARYYAPPGSHRTSHFHLYRINPDGTGRTQLTFGNEDDSSPQWSPDGRWIAFTRQTVSGHSALCLIRSTGGPVKKLLDAGLAGNFGDDYSARWSPDGKMVAVVHLVFLSKSAAYSVSLISPQTGQILRRFVGASGFYWSPDSRHAYLKAASGDEWLDLQAGVVNHVNATLESLVMSGQNLIGFGTDEKSGTYFLSFLSAEGREIKQIKLNFSYTYPGMDADEFSPGYDSLLSIPSTQQLLIYALNNHTSTRGEWLFFWLNLAGGAMRYLTEGQFLAWSPDGSRFCTTPGRATTPYEKRRYPFSVIAGASVEECAEDEPRTVWAAPLYIRASQGGPMRQLTPRLSWVTGADWRKRE